MSIVWCIISGNIIMIVFNLFGMVIGMECPSAKVYSIIWPTVILILVVITNLETLIGSLI